MIATLGVLTLVGGWLGSQAMAESDHPTWQPRAATAWMLSWHYAILFALAALLSCFAPPQGRHWAAYMLGCLRGLAGSVKARCRRGFKLDARDGLFLAFALVLGLGLRWCFVGQPIRYDEAYSYLQYAEPGFLNTFYYTIPNNHVLNSLFMRLTTSLWGPSVEAIRISALVTGLAIIPAIFFVARRFGATGVLSAIAVAASGYLTLYATNARGYSMLVLCTLGLLWILTWPGGRMLRWGPWAYALIGAVGMWAVPTMLFPAASVLALGALKLLFEKDSPKADALRFALPAGLLFSVFTFICYTPVILISNGYGLLVENRYVVKDAPAEFFGELPSLLAKSWRLFTEDVPLVVQLALVGLFLVGLYAAYRKRNWTLLLAPGVFVIVSAAILIAKQAVPFARTWMYFIPLALIVADYGWSWMLAGRARQMQFAAQSLLLLGGLWIAANLVAEDRVTQYEETGKFLGAREAAIYLSEVWLPTDNLVVPVPGDLPTFYYLSRLGLDIHFRGKVEQPTNVYYLLWNGSLPLDQVTNHPVVIVEQNDAFTLYRYTPPRSGGG